MSSPVETVARGSNALAAAERMADKRVRHLVVVDAKGHVSGVLSDRDLRSAQPSTMLVPDVDMRRKALALLRVDDVMTSHPIVAQADSPLDRAIEAMAKAKVGCMPVVGAHGDLVGIVTGGDVAKLAVRLLRAHSTHP